VRPIDIEHMDDVLRRMEDTPHPTRTTIALDREFHTMVAGILGNAVLVRCIGELFDQRMNPYFERLSSYFENRESWRAAAEEHRAVREPERAKAAMQEHLRQSQLRFSRNFGEKSAAREAGG
ncbi:MAG: FCD domain-containing protein, partial [Mesorhizobium sp.]